MSEKEKLKKIKRKIWGNKEGTNDRLMRNKMDRWMEEGKRKTQWGETKDEKWEM